MTDSAHPADEDQTSEIESTRCPRCFAPYEAVRPGKLQPSCPCDYIERLRGENDELRARMQSEKERAAAVVTAAPERERRLREALDFALGRLRSIGSNLGLGMVHPNEDAQRLRVFASRSVREVEQSIEATVPPPKLVP